MSDFDEKLKLLKQPFPQSEIEWRVGTQGVTSKGEPWLKALAYLTNRAIQNRLDEVFGPMGWKNEYREWRGTSQLCGISVWYEERGEWIAKWDGADSTDIEAVKGGLSDSMKRAAVQWGIGRYLYNLEAGFVNKISKTRPSSRDGWNHAFISKDQKGNKSGENCEFYWQPPDLPDWALPAGETPPAPKPADKKPPRPPRGKHAKNLAEAIDNLGFGNNESKEAFCRWMTDGTEFEFQIPGLTVAGLSDEEMAGLVLTQLTAMKKAGWTKERIQEAVLAVI